MREPVELTDPLGATATWTGPHGPTPVSAQPLSGHPTSQARNAWISNDGSELYYAVVDFEAEVTMLIVSFGDVQPGRYAAAPEALIRTSSGRS